MKKKRCIAAIALLLLVALALFFTSGFLYAWDRTFVPYTGGPDLYSATGEDLAQLDKCGYSAAFGKSERPYIVRFNETADAWIVRGSKGFQSLGGVAVAAIDRSTGEVIMLFHTK